MFESKAESGLVVGEGNGLRIRQLREGGFGVSADGKPEEHLGYSVGHIADIMKERGCSEKEVSDFTVLCYLSQEGKPYPRE